MPSLAASKRSPVTNFGSLRCGFHLLAFGDVLNGEQDQFGVLAIWRKWAGVEQHGLASEDRKGMLNFNIFDRVVEGENIIQQRPQARTSPGSIA